MQGRIKAARRQFYVMLRPRQRYVSRKLRLERGIMAMLATFSISIGLWENFRQLWLQDNGFSATEVSNITSFGLIVSVLGILLVGRTVKMRKIKQFMVVTSIVRTANLLLLFFINFSELRWLIDACIVIDVLAGALIITSVYPMLTTVMKSNGAYSRRKLVEYLFRDIGILIGGMVIGQQVGNWVVDYNACLMIAVVFSVLSVVTVSRLKFHFTEPAVKSRFSIVRYVIKSRLQRTYMLYSFLAATAFMASIGLKMLMLTDYFNFSAGLATNYLLVAGLAADVIGILALHYFTPKNDYLTMTIKFGIRMLIFIGAFFSDNLFLCFIALTWTLLSSTAYENISDGYYINAVDNRHQLRYNTLKYVVSYTGNALGMFLCGQMFELGIEYIFGLSALLIVVQLVVAYYLIYLRQSKKVR